MSQPLISQSLIHQFCHDIQNPSTVVIGLLDIINDELLGPVSESQKQSLLNMYFQIRFISTHTRALDWISKLPTLTPSLTTFDLVALIDKQLSLTKKVTQQKDLSFQVTYEHPQHTTKADITIVSYMIALCLDIALGSAPKQSSITIAVSKSNNDHAISISDTGRQLTADELDCLSQCDSRLISRDFSRLSGLSMYACDQLAQLFGGQMALHSNSDQTTTTIHLPDQTMPQ